MKLRAKCAFKMSQLSGRTKILTVRKDFVTTSKSEVTNRKVTVPTGQGTGCRKWLG